MLINVDFVHCYVATYYALYSFYLVTAYCNKFFAY